MKTIILNFLLLACCAASVSAGTVAFTNVNVVPMDRPHILRDRTVLVRDGIIAEIGRDIKVPADAVRIEGRGRYLIPGLIDMHTHLLSDGEDYPDSIAGDELRVMVANGVTTIRLMIGTPEHLELRRRAAAGEIVAPTIYAASPHLTGRAGPVGNSYVVTTPEAAREAVREAVRAGYDFIKITTHIDAAVYEAAVAEAARAGIRVVGHADSRFVGLERAFRAKQQIEHLDGYMEALLADDAPMKGSVSDLYIADPRNWESLDHIDEKKIPELARRTVAANPYVNPTQHFMKNTFGLPRSEESIRSQPDFRFYPEEVRERYLGFYKRHRLFEVPAGKRAAWVSIRDRLILEIHRAGGKLMTGSDTPEFLWLYGFSVHRELKALREAGLSNYAALEAATRNPAEFLGMLGRAGTIETGKRADLVLLEADPLADITNTEKRAGVMLGGKYYMQKELDEWLEQIAPRIAGSYRQGGEKEDERAAAAVADGLFEAMRAKDTEAISKLFLDEGQLTLLISSPSGKEPPAVKNFPAADFARMIAGAGGGEIIEKMPDKKVRLYGDAAVVTGRYTFHIGEKFSHCGVNAFHLLRSEGIWKIANATSTRETTGCGEDAEKKKPAGDEAKNALAVVEELFERMAAHDPPGIVDLHMPDARLSALVRGRDGKVRFANHTREGFSKLFETKRAELSEKMYEPNVHIDGDLAVVDGRYIFIVGDKLSHCGMNSFHLVRTAGGWKLMNAVSTIEPDGCTEREKAMVK